MNQRISEIQSFLSHQDHSLAIRRMLDLALDSGDESLLTQTISWSRKHRKTDDSKEVKSTFYEEAELLLTQLAQSIGNLQPAKENLLQAQGISKTYQKGNFSLQPINVSISSGDVVGVVGENGNGKTTLLRCMAGQLSIDSGNIAYYTLKDPDHYAIKHHLAFIPQRIPRWRGQLKDNLHFSASIAGITGKQNELMVDYVLERMNLLQYAHLDWSQISSGYRTRFEIARVLLQRPRILLLDEPLANLDILAQQTLLTDLRYMAKSVKHPMGVVLSSQQLFEVEKIADTVLFIKNGQCLYKTNETKKEKTNAVIEIETAADRTTIAQVFVNGEVQIQFNGGYYTISSSTLTVHDIIQKILNHSLTVSYFRDITHSTKRFF